MVSALRKARPFAGAQGDNLGVPANRTSPSAGSGTWWWYMAIWFSQGFNALSVGSILILIAITVMLGNLISDVMLAWLDPRVRYD